MTFLPLLDLSFPSLCSFITLWTLRLPLPSEPLCECDAGFSELPSKSSPAGLAETARLAQPEKDEHLMVQASSAVRRRGSFRPTLV